RWIERPLENDDVAALRMPERGKVFAGKRDLRTVHHLVDQEEVAHEQRLLHAPARDLERLDEERPDEQEQDDRDRERLCPLEKESPVLSRAAVHAPQCFGT